MRSRVIGAALVSLAICSAATTAAQPDHAAPVLAQASVVTATPTLTPVALPPLDRASRGDARGPLARKFLPPVTAQPVVKATPKPKVATPKPVAKKSVVKHKIVHHVVHHAAVSSSRLAMWNRLVACESPDRGWRYGAPGVGIDAGYYYEGGPNFAPSTWVNYGGRAFAPHAWGASIAEQIIVAERVLASEGVHAWPVCGPRTGLHH